MLDQIERWFDYEERRGGAVLVMRYRCVTLRRPVGPYVAGDWFDWAEVDFDRGVLTLGQGDAGGGEAARFPLTLSVGAPAGGDRPPPIDLYVAVDAAGRPLAGSSDAALERAEGLALAYGSPTAADLAGRRVRHLIDAERGEGTADAPRDRD